MVGWKETHVAWDDLVGNKEKLTSVCNIKSRDLRLNDFEDWEECNIKRAACTSVYELGQEFPSCID